ncbi:hypothetical protein L1987_45014 [Smallanthus sonchifolius]|uniref:Uncharacterized protein n=1 Tax=Smallanthus sonchifolius TaxID=185202 RepID=A0ACB9GQU2_9ASTR|nr:hypothetical protein L1987_45014 [Smallanthus sonchifolius]
MSFIIQAISSVTVCVVVGVRNCLSFFMRLPITCENCLPKNLENMCLLEKLSTVVVFKDQVYASIGRFMISVILYILFFN